MDPITIGVAALSSIGSLLKGIMAYNQGKAIKRQMDMRAEQARNEAGINATVELDKMDRTSGEAAVDAAANGGGLSGSSMEAMADIARRGMFNARSQLYRGQVASENALYQGRVAQRQGALSLISSTFDAASSLAGSFGQSAKPPKPKAFAADLTDSSYG